MFRVSFNIDRFFSCFLYLRYFVIFFYVLFVLIAYRVSMIISLSLPKKFIDAINDIINLVVGEFWKHGE